LTDTPDASIADVDSEVVVPHAVRQALPTSVEPLSATLARLVQLLANAARKPLARQT